MILRRLLITTVTGTGTAATRTHSASHAPAAKRSSKRRAASASGHTAHFEDDGNIEVSAIVKQFTVGTEHFHTSVWNLDDDGCNVLHHILPFMKTTHDDIESTIRLILAMEFTDTHWHQSPPNGQYRDVPPIVILLNGRDFRHWFDVLLYWSLDVSWRTN